MGDTRFITVRYAGRVHDVVSYEAAAIMNAPTTIDEIAKAEAEAKIALFESHPQVFNVRTTVACGFGFSHQTIVVVAAGEVYDCINCGGRGHRMDDCPQPKSE